VVGVVLLIGLAQPVITAFPYYLSYYNPLLGGGAVAQHTLLIGWGEGMDQVGAYLRERPDIDDGPVLSALPEMLQPFVPVLVRDVTDLNDVRANYAVVYIESVQRGVHPEIYNAIRETVPLYRVTIHGIDYATIYQLPKPFAQAVNAQFGSALNLRGVTIVRTAGQLTVTPSWDVRGALPTDYQLFLKLLDDQGKAVAQIDVSPGGSDFPTTSAWQAGQEIAVPLPLPLPATVVPGSYDLVLGLYNPSTGERAPLVHGTPADIDRAGPDALSLGKINFPSQ